jgi:hypothetical protein
MSADKAIIALVQINRCLAMTKQLLFALLLAMILFFCFTIYFAYSQVPVPVGPGDGDYHTTPISGMAILAVLGGAYAVKKLWVKRD